MINVRSAFRILYYFNDRILSLVKYIEKTFGIPCVWDKSHWIEPPIQGRNNLSKRKWGWNWLSLFCYEFHFEKENVKFSIFLQSDTGAWNIEDWSEVDNFTNINESKTRLLFIFSNSKEWDISILLNKHYQELLEDEYSIKTKNNEIYFKAFDLVKFKDEKETINSLNILITFLKNKGNTNINIISENK